MFPTFLFVHDHADSARMNERLIEFSYAARAADPTGRVISSRGGWQSHPDMRLRSEFQPLIRFIDETISRMKVYLDVVDRFDLRVSDMWININGKGNYNTPHIHGNAFFSGVYYVKTHDGCVTSSFTSLRISVNTTARPTRRSRPATASSTNAPPRPVVCVCSPPTYPMK